MTGASARATEGKSGPTRGQWIAIGYALAFLVLGGAGIWFVWTRVGASYSIEARFHEVGAAASDPGLASNTTLSSRDQLVLDVECSRPVFVYVLRETTGARSGETEPRQVALLFPLPGQTLANPLPAGQHRLPSAEGPNPAAWSVGHTGTLRGAGETQVNAQADSGVGETQTNAGADSSAGETQATATADSSAGETQLNATADSSAGSGRQSATFIVVTSPRPVLVLEDEVRYLAKIQGERVDIAFLDEQTLRKLRETPGIAERLPSRAERAGLGTVEALSSLVRPLEMSAERVRGVWSRGIAFDTF